jgi:hypothetical protein
MSVHLTGVHLIGVYLISVYLISVHLMSVSHRRDLTGVQLVGGFCDFDLSLSVRMSRRTLGSFSPWSFPQNHRGVAGKLAQGYTR